VAGRGQLGADSSEDCEKTRDMRETIEIFINFRKKWNMDFCLAWIQSWNMDFWLAWIQYEVLRAQGTYFGV
jgi:hypothetical protein